MNNSKETNMNQNKNDVVINKNGHDFGKGIPLMEGKQPKVSNNK